MNIERLTGRREKRAAARGPGAASLSQKHPSLGLALNTEPGVKAALFSTTIHSTSQRREGRLRPGTERTLYSGKPRVSRLLASVF